MIAKHYQKIFILLLLVMVTWPQFLFAHEVKLQNDISVTLHMEPQDDPVVGEPGELFLSFKDFQNRFNIDDCDCSAKVFSKDKVLFNGHLSEKAGESFGSNSVVINTIFPKKAIYTVSLIAKSKTGVFPDVKMDFFVRIARESTGQTAQSRNIPQNEVSKEKFKDLAVYILPGVVLVGGVIIILIKFRSAKRREKTAARK
jgi:hypothetical protein